MSSPDEEEGRQRLFFALWPDEALRQQLTRVSRQFTVPPGAKRVDPDNLHITLAFLGSVAAETRRCLEQQATQLALSPFTLTLDQQGFWPKPQVAWLGCSNPPQPLLQLAQALKQAQLACGMEPEARPFHTHLTLLRKVRQASPLVELPPLTWAVRDFALVCSETHQEGGQYRVVRRFSLKNDAPNEGLGTLLPSMK